MNPLYTATVKAPPSVNLLYSVGRKNYGRSAQCALYKNTYIKAWHDTAMYNLRKPRELITEPVSVVCDFYIMKGDIDNRFKALLDLFNGTVWRDDKQVMEICAHKHIITDKEQERAEISVYAYPLSPITEIQRVLDALHPGVALTLLEGVYCALLQEIASFHRDTAVAAQGRLYVSAQEAIQAAQ